MPYVICPVCSASYHLVVRGNLQAWEAEHVTERTENGAPLLTCIRCWVELKPGYKVTLRTEHGQLPAGSEGIVQSCENEKFSVSFGTLQAELARSELFYVVGQSPPSSA